MELVGLRGDRVRLVPPDRRLHLDNALRWLNDPEVTATLEFNHGVSRGEEEAFFDRIESAREPDLVWAVLDEARRHIGFTGLHGLHWRRRCATGGLVLGERDAWGKGYATDTVRTRTRFAFGQLGLHRVEGHTFNPSMRRVYERCGYTLEGVQRRKFWRDGRWHDVALYAILEDDYFATPEAGPRPVP
jgi:RimJ/RimL family protein N-acetyltransferase